MSAPQATTTPKPKVEQIRISILGDTDTGKDCLAKRYCFDMFMNEYDPTYEGEGHRKQCAISGIRCMLTVDHPHPLWTDSSNHAFVVASEADALLLAYDGTSPKSIDVIRLAKQKLQPHISGAAFPPIVVAATKSDRAEELGERWEENLAVGRALANELDVPFFTTSSLLGNGVQEAIEDLATKVLQGRGVLEGSAVNPDETAASQPAEPPKKRSKLCCFA
ncbi:P-loop containing nucleoside triphosphate hydrolase protein [Dactylonectria estremocensis]|uniref:P-loop containing nucleoside triphosphate hydrolase protein n=1 Tax=Dactylonectria estremocensis TaxID=1079267 RepID=A0A9P9F1U2_9HYPO|nr:P-loop containing nucleoside triphosphate hydrolase protein [Dactylonectria estremocensis]